MLNPVTDEYIRELVEQLWILRVQASRIHRSLLFCLLLFNTLEISEVLGILENYQNLAETSEMLIILF